MQKTDYSGLIRRILQDEGLAGAVQKLPLERKFKLETVKDVRALSQLDNSQTLMSNAERQPCIFALLLCRFMRRWKCCFVQRASFLQVVRISDGFQPHLVSPELGLRKLVHESIEMVLDPVATSVRRVHHVLLEVARCSHVYHTCQIFDPYAISKMIILQTREMLDFVS